MREKGGQIREEAFWRGFGLAVLAVCMGLMAVFVPNLVLSLLRLCWHYLLCALCLFAGWKLKRRGWQRMALAAAVLSLLIAVIGFFAVFSGPFVESGKTFQMYLTRYGLYTLPIFLFPAVGFLLAFRVKK